MNTSGLVEGPVGPKDRPPVVAARRRDSSEGRGDDAEVRIVLDDAVDHPGEVRWIEVSEVRSEPFHLVAKGCCKILFVA